MMALMVSGMLTACRETEVPLQPEPPAPPPADTTNTTVTRFTPVVCTVNVAERKTRCGAPEGAVSNNDLIVGGQGRYIDVETGGDSYNINTQQYSFSIAVRNRIGQKMGTTDGLISDPRGVRLFFADGPNLMSGAGAIDLMTVDGYGNYTGGQQPYLNMTGGILEKNAISSPRFVIFQMPGTVTSFSYTVYVATVVQYPHGWIEVTPASFPIAPGSQWKMLVVHRDVMGDVITNAPTTWAIADTTIATLRLADGLATGVRAGSVLVTATSGLRTGSAILQVSGIQRTWDGSADTNWHNKFNWVGDVVPVAQDSAHFAAGLVRYPSLTANAVINQITADEGAPIALNSFDLTAGGSVTVGLSPGITNTTGRLILTGIARTLQGRIGRVRVTGSYSLTGNLTTRAPIEVAAGRLQSAGFRIQAESN